MSDSSNNNPLLQGLGGYGAGSMFGYGLGGGGVIGAWNFQQVVQLVDAPTEAKKPEKVEELDRSQYDALGGTVGSQYIGYPDTPIGGMQTYRLMDATSPTLVITYAAITGPIISGVPSFKIRNSEGKIKTRTSGPIVGDGVKVDPLDQRADLIEQMFLPLWSDLMFGCSRTIRFGHYPFEVLWDVRHGRNWIREFAELLPESVDILVDQKKNYLGLRPRYGLTGPDLIGWNSFNCTYDCEARNHRGRPRYENVRQEWWRLLKDDLQGSRLDDKAAGYVFSVAAPLGAGFTDEKGKPMGGKDTAQGVAQGLSAGRSVYLPNFAFSAKEIVNNPGLAARTAFDIHQWNLGDSAGSQSAILDKLKFRNINLVRGMCRPEREILEATKGGMGQGDSSTHGQIGIVDSEMIMASFYRQINRGPINNVLRLNYGPDAADSVFSDPAPLADPQVEYLQKLLLAIMADPQGVQMILPKIDKDALLDRTETPALETPDELPPLPGAQLGQSPANGENGKPALPMGKRMAAGAALSDRINGKAA